MFARIDRTRDTILNSLLVSPLFLHNEYQLGPTQFWPSLSRATAVVRVHVTYAAQQALDEKM